jgi:uncharacterized protein YfkK (UPF0435 family)
MGNEINKIGIDKLELNCVILADINYEKLIDQGDANLTLSASQTPLFDGKNYYKRIFISSQLDFCDVTITAFSLAVYVSLTFYVSRINQNNLIPLSCEEYSAYIIEAERQIESKYGISLDTSAARIKNIEIAGNLITPRPYEEYLSVLRVIVFSMRKNLRFDSYDNSTFYMKNNSKEIVFYDKTHQMQENKKGDCEAVPLDVMRFEIRLKGKRNSTIIKNNLGTNLWSELTDEMIYDYYQRFVKNEIMVKFEKWESGRYEELKKLYRKIKKSGSKQWPYILLKTVFNRSKPGVLYILDIAQLADAVNDVLRKKKDRNRWRKVRRLYDIVSDGEKYGLKEVELLNQQNLEKADELFKLFDALCSASIASLNDAVGDGENGSTSTQHLPFLA